MKPRISTVIPVYNAATYLRECLNSVLAQVRRPDEIVVCDDASTDETPKVLAEYSGCVRVVRNDRNLGVGPSLNRAISASSGEYIAIIAADDRWQPEHLKRLGALLDRFGEAGVAFAPVSLIGLREGIWPSCSAIPCFDAPRFVLVPLVRNNFVHPCGAVFRRSVWEEVEGFQEIEVFYKGRRVQAEDYDFWLRVAVRHKFVAQREPTAQYRWHSAQSSQNSVAQYVLAFRYRERLLKELRARHIHENLWEDLERAFVVAWEEYLERVWRERNLEGLRYMVAYGIANPLVRSSTWHYAVRALLPRVIITLRDSMRSRG